MNKCVMFDVGGWELTPEEREILAHPAVYGVILFARNYVDKKQLKKLTADIKQIDSSLLIGVDQEGGRVQRFQEEFTAIPAAVEFGRLYDKNPQSAENDLKKTFGIVAQELKDVGIDINFAPVLDLNYGTNKVINDRSFHADKKIVAHLGKIYAQELARGGIKAVAKHFPGHGFAEADSHVAFAVDERDDQTIADNDLYPFAEVIQQGIFGIMPAHVVYAAVDKNAAGFSKYWLRDILRASLKFKGVIFSDDLNMFAASNVGNMPARAIRALDAGCDVVLICNNRNGVQQTLEVNLCS